VARRRRGCWWHAGGSGAFGERDALMEAGHEVGQTTSSASDLGYCWSLENQLVFARTNDEQTSGSDCPDNSTYYWPLTSMPPDPFGDRNVSAVRNRSDSDNERQQYHQPNKCSPGPKNRPENCELDDDKARPLNGCRVKHPLSEAGEDASNRNTNRQKNAKSGSCKEPMSNRKLHSHRGPPQLDGFRQHKLLLASAHD